MKIAKPQSRTAMACCIATMLLASGCETDAQRARAEGAAAGAVLGGVTGKVIGGDKHDAIAGAVLGGLAGAVIGDRVAGKKAHYAAREDELLASAERATMLARASEERNEQLTRDIAALDRSVQRLRSARMSAEAKRALALENRRKQQDLLADVDGQLRQLREESSRQSALIRANGTPPGSGTTAQPPSEGIRLVAASMRSVDQQTRALELAKLNLQKIDQRRAY